VTLLFAWVGERYDGERYNIGWRDEKVGQADRLPDGLRQAD
jgi:hypothetical protein